MEGWLMHKAFFNNWKMKYVVCSDNKLTISKNATDEKSKTTFNIMDCSIKRIDSKQYNRKYVFRVKIANKRIYFAAEDDNSLVNWMNAIRGRVQRASLLGANPARCEGHRRSSPMASLSRADCAQLVSFQFSKMASCMSNVVLHPEDPQAQFAFSELCGEFLAISHAHAQGLFHVASSQSTEGITVQQVPPQNRKAFLHQMRAVSQVFAARSESIFVPLQCLIDYGGQSYFFEAKIDGSAALSPANIEKLTSLGIPPTSAVQDASGRIWVSNAGLSQPPDDSFIKSFVKDLDSMKLFVFDSLSLSEAMKAASIPVSKLPLMAEASSIPGVRILLQIEMIARAAKAILADSLSKLSQPDFNVEVVKFFNLVLGSSDSSKDFWQKSLTPKAKALFNVALDKNLPLMHLQQLFFSLQFHTGADFLDSDSYDFSSPNPIKQENLVGLNAVPHHCLVEICSFTRKLKGDEYSLLMGGFFNEAVLAYNSKVSLYQSIYGDENILVAFGLSLLSSAYLGLGDTEKAVTCAKGALAGRNIHAALIPAHITMILTAQADAIENLVQKAKAIVVFHLGSWHWFLSDIYVAAATAFQENNDLQTASRYAQQSIDITETVLGAGHPKSSRCLLLKGRIQRAMKQYASAQPLVEQAIYSMKAAYGDKSSQYADCLYEYAEVLIDSGLLTEASAASKECIGIREALFGTENSFVMESVQQMAVIYDSLGKLEEAIGYYRRLLHFLKSLEDESVFKETVMVIRNELCLYFRNIGPQHRQLLNQLKRRQIPDSQALMKELFEQMIERDPVEIATSLVNEYQSSGSTKNFDSLAAIYHIATDELSTLTYLEAH